MCYFTSTWNIAITIILFDDVVTPDTFNDGTCVEAPLNIIIPDTFNDGMHVVALFNVVFPDIFNFDTNVKG